MYYKIIHTERKTKLMGKAKKVTPSLEVIGETIKNNMKDNKQALALSLYEELVFMKDTLIKLKAEIEVKGVTENFKNGKQDFIRESQALKSYNNTLKNYSKCIKDLYDIVPTIPLKQYDKDYIPVIEM